MLPHRSFLPGFIEPRVSKTVTILVKQASEVATIDSSLDKIASMYNGIKKYASQLTPKDIKGGIPALNWLRTALGLGVYMKLVDTLSKDKNMSDLVSSPASDFENVIGDTKLSGKMSMAKLSEQLVLPGAYITASIGDNNMVYAKNGGLHINDWMSKVANLNNIAYKASISLHFNL